MSRGCTRIGTDKMEKRPPDRPQVKSKINDELMKTINPLTQKKIGGTQVLASSPLGRHASFCCVSIQVTVFVWFAFLMYFAIDLHSQTTLSGDHIITGDLNVGTSGTTGNVLVTGETGNSASPGLKVMGDGGVIFSGSYGVGQLPVMGAGLRFMWYPKKAAIRAGEVTGNWWDDSQIGAHSVAMGFQVWAGQPATVAMGGYTMAVNTYAAAFNGGTAALGQAAVTFNYFTTASGIASFAAGYDTLASGQSAASFGDLTSAVGDCSMTMGSSTIAYGDNSVASGQDTYAGGASSFAIGVNTVADAYATTVVGRWNVGGGDGEDWEAEDPLFEVGNGTGDENDPPEIQRRNAFTVYKNGNVIIPKRQGDILMGEFGSPE